MTFLKIVFLLLLIPTFVIAGTAGSGGGGDTLICRDEPNVSPFAGYYNLDYLATYQKGNHNADLVKIESWETSAERIIRNLKRLKANNLLGTFLQFSRNIGNEDDYSDGLIWKESGFGLEDIKDENLLNKLPANCIPEKNSNQFVQTVYWQDYNNLRIYNFDYDIVEKLRSQSALQLSFLYVHEWLWMHFESVEPIRFLNRLIHSEKFDTMTSEEFRQIVSALKPSFYARVQTGEYLGPNGNTIGFYVSDHLGGKRTILHHNIKGYGSSGIGFSFRCNFDGEGLYSQCEYADKHYWDASSRHGEIEEIVFRVIDFKTVGVLREGMPEEIYKFSPNSKR